MLNLSELQSIYNEVNARLEQEVKDFPEIVCACGHTSNSHSTCLDAKLAERYGLITALEEDDEYAIFYHRCLFCGCEGFWRE